MKMLNTKVLNVVKTKIDESDFGLTEERDSIKLKEQNNTLHNAINTLCKRNVLHSSHNYPFLSLLNKQQIGGQYSRVPLYGDMATFNVTPSGQYSRVIIENRIGPISNTISLMANRIEHCVECLMKDMENQLFNGKDSNGISGLAAWIPESAPIANDSFFGIDRSVDPVRLSGVKKTNENGLRDALMNAAMDIAEYGGKPDIAFIPEKEWIGLHSIMGPTSKIAIISTPFLTNKAYVLSMDSLRLLHIGDLINTDAIKSMYEDSYEVRMSSYCNLACRAPSHNAVINLYNNKEE